MENHREFVQKRAKISVSWPKIPVFFGGFYSSVELGGTPPFNGKSFCPNLVIPIPIILFPNLDVTSATIQVAAGAKEIFCLPCWYNATSAYLWNHHHISLEISANRSFILMHRLHDNTFIVYHSKKIRSSGGDVMPGQQKSQIACVRLQSTRPKPAQGKQKFSVCPGGAPPALRIRLARTFENWF